MFGCCDWAQRLAKQSVKLCDWRDALSYDDGDSALGNIALWDVAFWDAAHGGATLGDAALGDAALGAELLKCMRP